jgi:hypothetical protein
MLPHWYALSPEVDNFKILAMPSIDEFSDDSHVEPYPYTKSWDDIKYDPVYIAQTSGTTGRLFNSAIDSKIGY